MNFYQHILGVALIALVNFTLAAICFLCGHRTCKYILRSGESGSYCERCGKDL
jgi:hypothetical protein